MRLSQTLDLYRESYLSYGGCEEIEMIISKGLWLPHPYCIVAYTQASYKTIHTRQMAEETYWHTTPIPSPMNAEPNRAGWDEVRRPKFFGLDTPWP